MLLEFLFIGFGAFLLIRGFKNLQSGKWLKQHGKSTKGHVIAVVKTEKRDRYGRLKTMHSPIVEFETVKREKVQHKLDFGLSWDKYPEGTVMKIIYDPADPKDCNMDDHGLLIYLPWVVIILGIVLFVVGALSLLEIVPLQQWPYMF